MTKTTIRRWATLSLLASGLVAACSDDNSDKPTQTINVGTGGAAAAVAGQGGVVAGAGVSATGQGGAITPAAGAASSAAGVGSSAAGASSSAGASGTAGASSSAAGTSNSAAGTTSAGATNLAGAAGQVDCLDTVKNCYSCTTTSDRLKANTQLLNHCTDGKCVAFDNKTLTKLSLVPAPPTPQY
jgi:hypothetical protein